MLALGRLILQHIDATGEAKKDFATRAGVSPQQLSGWIRPDAELKAYPEPQTMKGLAKALGVTQRELLAVVSDDVGYAVEEEEVDAATTLLIASVRPLSDKRKQRLIQIAKDFGDD